MENTKKVNIVTLGCAKNTVDSENLAGHLVKSGYKVTFDSSGRDADIVIINTCGFIGDAKEESIDTILQYVDANEGKRKKQEIIVCGCLAERYRKELQEEISEVTHFFGVHEWDKILAMLSSSMENALYDKRIQSTPKHYAYLKIAEGCDRSCSYCAIPLIRGKHISRPLESIVEEAKQLVKDGVKELIVISQDTTYYGVDLYGERMLGTLLERLASESGAEWIRLHYTFPTGFPEDVLDVMAKHKNICKYIDIPLQHIDTGILQSMKRGIDREETLALIQKIRNILPEAALRTTLITGYPNETEAAFEALKVFVKESRFDRMGVFTYSPEEQTPAFPLGDTIPEELKIQRMEELMSIQQQISMEINESRVGKTYKVLVDRREGDFWIGRTEFDSPEIDNEIILQEKELKAGSFYTVKILRNEEFDLYGEVVDELIIC